MRYRMGDSRTVYVLLVQLPGFARVGPPTPQPTHTTTTPNKPKSKKKIGKKSKKYQKIVPKNIFQTNSKKCKKKKPFLDALIPELYKFPQS
jgi:hypothetical protein